MADKLVVELKAYECIDDPGYYDVTFIIHRVRLKASGDYDAKEKAEVLLQRCSPDKIVTRTPRAPSPVLKINS